MIIFISEACEGETCFCGAPAMRKVGETIFDDDPQPIRHELTAYLCGEHFAQIMGPAGGRSVGLDHGAAVALPLAADVVRLVIAARNVAYEVRPDKQAMRELDLASEAFDNRVPWENEP